MDIGVSMNSFDLIN